MSIKIESTTDSKEVVSAVMDAANGVVPEAVETPAADETPPETLENSDAQDAVETESEDGAVDAPKKKGGFQKKIGKLTKQREDARKEADYWRQEALKNQAPPAENPQKVKVKAQPVEGKPSADKFETHEDYVEALADWKVEQKLIQRDQEQKQNSLKSEQEKQLKSYLEKRDDFAKSHDDFFDAMEDIKNIQMSLTVNEALLTSENGPELLYELAKNPDEYKRICALPAIAAAREIGRFESRLLKTSETSEQTQETKTSRAPTPIRPVGSKTTGSGKKTIFDQSLTQAEYEALRREQIAKKA